MSGFNNAMVDAEFFGARIGVEGVPFFIFNRRYAVSGAQEPEALLDTMLKSASEATVDGA